MGITLIFVSQSESDGFCVIDFGLIGLLRGSEGVPGNNFHRIRPYPKPTQVVMVEYTKALERTMLKELGKLPS